MDLVEGGPAGGAGGGGSAVLHAHDPAPVPDRPGPDGLGAARDRHLRRAPQTDSTLRYIHLSGRELAEKLNSSMAQIHAWRVQMLTEPVAAAPAGAAMNAVPCCRPVPRQRPWPAGAWHPRTGTGTAGASCSTAKPPPSRATRAVGLRRNRARGIPRRTARHWQAISRLVEPLDAARAALHHGDDPAFRRAGAHAAAIVLQHCADTGRSYWAWTPWDWAGLCGPSAAGRSSPPGRCRPRRTVRPFLVALAYLLGGFTGFHHLGNFNRLHLAGLVFGADAGRGRRSARPRGSSTSGATGIRCAPGTGCAASSARPC